MIVDFDAYFSGILYEENLPREDLREPEREPQDDKEDDSNAAKYNI